MGADRIVCAGDLVGYGPFPDRVVAFLRERQVSSVRGNHDRWALERGPGVRDEFGGGTPSRETLDFLRQLPPDLLVAHQTDDRRGRPWLAVIRHGVCHPAKPSARRPAQYLLDLNCELLVVGHTHQPMWFRCPDGLVVNPGSVVSSARIDSSRTFALVDLDMLEVTFHDVESGATIEVGGVEWNASETRP